MMGMSAENSMHAIQPLCQQTIRRQPEVGEDQDNVNLRRQKTALLA
jgi:hypothetical protein